jgi:hypothetical protein
MPRGPCTPRDNGRSEEGPVGARRAERLARSRKERSAAERLEGARAAVAWAGPRRDAASRPGPPAEFRAAGRAGGSRARERSGARESNRARSAVAQDDAQRSAAAAGARAPRPVQLDSRCYPRGCCGVRASRCNPPQHRPARGLPRRDATRNASRVTAGPGRPGQTRESTPPAKHRTTNSEKSAATIVLLAPGPRATTGQSPSAVRRAVLR